MITLMGTPNSHNKTLRIKFSYKVSCYCELIMTRNSKILAAINVAIKNLAKRRPQAQ